ncbi:DUF4440 domain-containing protein [Bernardetia sp. Wsw4-3y2]|uniref:DUF4440 domain-containing protein n=1 Tax=Bernardetia sp. Wsw4-3y2 TaxID=3127471 RepID=UPI0030D520D6
MTKKITLFIFIFFSVYSLQAQNVKPEEKQSIKQLIQSAFDDVWGELDSTKIEKYHTDDFLLLEHGEIWTNDTIKSCYIAKARTAEKLPKRTNSFEFIRFVKSKNSIWFAYQNYATLSIDGKKIMDLQWLESAVAIKTKQGWKLQMLHSTRVARD